ncbi:cupin domain-containing protein [Bradyrhizobium sp. dw_78]|uniref:cupin domain-containing protein n=1 Tax=Bradyrhizobium sp. dw_78 TaxID=2719793 RepID=UPI001BD2F2CB|nr:cupin domain-containing protein [Bradyrhizobium sp. dw_78]
MTKKFAKLPGLARRLALAAPFLIVACEAAPAEDAEIKTIAPDSVKLVPSPTGVMAAYVVGAQNQPGVFVISTLYPAGVKSKPHTHPNERIMIVQSGTFYAGSGPVFDESKVRKLEPGSVIYIPANTLHWGWAKDGDVRVEETGMGPTANQFPATQ